MPDAQQFESRMQRLDEILRQAEHQGDPAVQAMLHELTAGLLEIHGQALARIFELVTTAGDAGASIIEAFGRDELLRPVLVLHGLHPSDLESRVRSALEKVRPYLASHGGRVQLLSVTADGVVRLRLEGSCHGCPSSRVTLQSTIEQEIYAAAPEVASIEVEGLDQAQPPQPGGFVPVDHIAINGSPVAAAAAP